MQVPYSFFHLPVVGQISGVVSSFPYQYCPVICSVDLKLIVGEKE